MHRFPLFSAILFGLLLALPASRPARAHCQIPCGIYDDSARFQHMEEILTTIEKSMKEIVELSAKPGENMNQVVRWVNNKEDHAEELADILRKYFLQQRFKAPAEDDAKGQERYIGLLKTTHQLLVAAMKCKQTTDTSHVEKARELLGRLQGLYEKR